MQTFCGVKLMVLHREQVKSRLTLVRGVWEKREKPSNRYSWSSYSITVGLSVWNRRTAAGQLKHTQQLRRTAMTVLYTNVLIIILWRNHDLNCADNTHTKKLVGGDTVIL